MLPAKPLFCPQRRSHLEVVGLGRACLGRVTFSPCARPLGPLAAGWGTFSLGGRALPGNEHTGSQTGRTWLAPRGHTRSFRSPTLTLASGLRPLGTPKQHRRPGGWTADVRGRMALRPEAQTQGAGKVGLILSACAGHHRAALA